MKPLIGTAILGAIMAGLTAAAVLSGLWTANLWVSAGLAIALLWLCWVDLREMRLPDFLTLPLIAAGLAWAFLVTEQLPASLAGALAGYAVIWGLEIFWRRVRGQEGIGLGDAKLLAGAGAWLGWMGLPIVLLVASASGLIVAGLGRIVLNNDTKPTQIIAFGPFLGLAFWFVWSFGSDPALWL